MDAHCIEAPRPLALEYLEHLEALRLELETATAAVGVNALATFEESVARQQGLCASLERLAGRMVAPHEPGVMQPCQNGDLARRICSAAESLRTLNLHYAALLKHSGESVRLFAGLCRSYSGQFHPGLPAAGFRGEWSC